MNKYHLNKSCLNRIKKVVLPVITTCVLLINSNLFACFTTIALTQEERNMPNKVDALGSIRERILDVQRESPDDGIIVDLNSFGLEEIGTWFFEELTNIVVLDLSGNSLIGIPAGIGGLKSLQELNFGGNYSTPLEVLELIDQLPNLQKLDLVGCSRLKDRHSIN